jgi:multiple antibiotic resistance protein
MEALAALGAESTCVKKAWWHGCRGGVPVLDPNHLAAFFSLTLALSALAAIPAHAQMVAIPVMTTSDFGARKIFLMLFLMIGPIKILVPFVEITRGADRTFRRTLARRAILFSAAALALAGVLGRSMLENFEISLPVLALTGGVVLFLVALRTVLQQSAGAPASASLAANPPDLKSAFAPLAFPTIVTPYGIAAVIVFATFAGEREGAAFTLAGIVLIILALDWVAMLFAETILRRIGTVLQVFAVVLGVTQIALGLQVILHSLCMIGVLAGCRS